MIKLLFYDTFVEEVLQREDFFTAKKREKLVDLKELILLLKRSNKKWGGGKNRIIYFIKYFFRKIHFATCIRSDQFYEQTCSISKLLFQQSRETFLRSKKKKKKRSPRVDPAFGFISEGKRDRSYLLSFPA